MMRAAFASVVTSVLLALVGASASVVTLFVFYQRIRTHSYTELDIYLAVLVFEDILYNVILFV